MIKKILPLAALVHSLAFGAPLSDSLSYKRIGDISMSPNDKYIAYTVSQIEPQGKGYKRYYYLYLELPHQSKKLLLKNDYVSQPIWSPNGKQLAFYTRKDDKQSIKIYDIVSQRESTFITLNNRGIYAYKWSPDGKAIAFVADDDKKPDSEKPVTVATDYVNSRIYLKSLSSKTASIEVLTLENESITQGYTPSLDGGFDWSADGKSIAYAHQKRAGANDIHCAVSIISLTDHIITNIPFMATHTANQPHYSPNGKSLAFVANIPDASNPSNFYKVIGYNSQICVSDLETLTTQCLANTPNQSAVIVGWSVTNDSIYVADWYKTKGLRIYAISIDSNKPAKLISDVDGFIEPLTMAYNAADAHFAFGFETTNKAPEIYQSKPELFKLEQMTFMQPPFAENLGKMEVVQWKSRNDLTIEGVLITPPNYDPHKKYPLLVDVHGGPAGAFAKRFIHGCDEFGEMIIPVCVKDVLDLGFIILQPNYRGSSGYGVNFRGANVGDLGGGDYNDIMSGVDFLINKGIADSNHLAIYGWSYGGYMTSWAVTQTNRFKAAVAGAGLTDFVSFIGTSDIPRYLQTYLAADLWNDKTLYLQRSPIFFSKNVVTSLLILHGKEDTRVPLTQSYEFYSALHLQNKPANMIVFPKQGHILTDGNMIVDGNNVTNDWLQKALK